MFCIQILPIPPVAAAENLIEPKVETTNLNIEAKTVI